MAKDAKEAKESKKRSSKSRAASLEGVQAADFFHENAKKKTVFKAGWDAKLGAMFKRIAAGKGDVDDKRLLKSKTLTGHDKVESSDHLRPLRDEAMNAG